MGASRQQVVLITGCSSGIGRALASEFARRGCEVAATARKLESLEELGQHERISTHVLDVLDQESITRAVAEVIARYGRIDMLINNAGFNLVGPLIELDLRDFEAIFATNVTGVLAVTRAVAAPMMRARSGRIVNIGSMVGVVGTPFTGAYCASKAALHMLSAVLRLELWPFGIEVISVEPGRVRSEISANARIDLARYEGDTSAYRSFGAGIRRRWTASQESPTDTATFARVIAHGITRRRAPRVLRAGRGALLVPLLARLAPPAVLDFFLRRIFGLEREAR